MSLNFLSLGLSYLFLGLIFFDRTGLESDSELESCLRCLTTLFELPLRSLFGLLSTGLSYRSFLRGGESSRNLYFLLGLCELSLGLLNLLESLLSFERPSFSARGLILLLGLLGLGLRLLGLKRLGLSLGLLCLFVSCLSRDLLLDLKRSLLSLS